MESTADPDAQLFVCEYDQAESKFLWVSANSKRIFGYSLNEMVGKGAEDFTDGSNNEEMFEVLDEAVEKGKGVGYFVNIYVRKDGKKVMMLWGDIQKPEDNVIVAYGMPITKDMLSIISKLKPNLYE